jgi:hypothetical protein
LRNSISCLVSLKVVFLLRWNVPTHRFGYRHRTTQLKTLYTTACTSRRIRRSFSTVTKFITTRRDIRIRTHQLISFGSHADKCIPTTGFPSSLSASWETQRHVPNQATSLMQWIGIIGRSVRGTYKLPLPLSRFIADVLFKLVAAVAFVRASTSQNGSCGLRSHGCFGLLTFDRCPMSLFPWMDIAASLHASRNHFVSLSH